MSLGILITLGFLLSLVFIMPQIKQKMYEAKYLKTRHVVETAWGILDYYAKQVKAGALSIEEGKKHALQAIKHLRYEKDDYFWVNDMKPNMIMHPIKPELDGKDLTENKDPTGKRLFVAFVEKVKGEGAGFVDYYWPKPGEPNPVPKISYVKGFPDWEWIIGSGIYTDDVERELRPIYYAFFSAIVLVGAAGLVMAFLMARSISRPITDAVRGLNEGADQVASASGQVSSASQSLASGCSEQASGLEETSSSLEEMSSMTRQNAENAGQADGMMNKARQIIIVANESMGLLTKSMMDISKAGNEISKIIKTIDEIAFQTNLLALNAAVEAARAGEAGAGFAVVAGEVRNLSMRAAEAAKNTADLIEGTIKKVNDGSELVTRTNDEFNAVATSVAKVGGLVAEIATASNEQADGIDQISKSVVEMDKIVQQNAAVAEESAGAAEEMSAQAEQMKAIVIKLVKVINGGSSRKMQSFAVPSDRKSLPAGKQKAADKTIPLPKAKAPLLPYGKGHARKSISTTHQADFSDF